MQERLADAIERAGGVPLAFAALGHRALATTTRELRVPEDLDGLAVRVTATPLLIDLFTGLGARPRSHVIRGRAGRIPLRDARSAGRNAGDIRRRAARCAWRPAGHPLGSGRGGRRFCREPGRVGWPDRRPARVGSGEAARQAAASYPRSCEPRTTRRSPALTRRGVIDHPTHGLRRAAFAAAARGAYDRWAAVAGEDLVRRRRSCSQGARALNRAQLPASRQATKRPSRTAVSPFFGRRVGMISTQSS